MNKAVLVGFLGFIIGASAGAGTAILLVKKRYEKKADDEIASVKKVYNDFFYGKQNNADEVITPEKEPTKQNKIVNKGSVDYSGYYGTNPIEKPNISYDHVGDKKERQKNIYLISPEGFRESDYPSVTLFYYADRVLADEDNNVIAVPEELIGDEALESFGRYEDDCVYVRDNIKKVDYEILKSDKKFSDILSSANET